MTLNSTGIILFTCAVTSLTAISMMANTSYAVENKIISIKSDVIFNSSGGKSAPQNDTTRPSVNITSPPYPPTTTTGKIVIEGSASDSESGIHNVSAAAHVFPFKGTFPVSLASRPIPSSGNNWSHWSVPLIINTTGTYRVVIEAKDNAGNVNYAETTINAALPEKNFVSATKTSMPKISFVRPTFTEAAYQEHGFYRFYFKYGFPPFGKNITTDIDMLTVKTPKSVSEFIYKNDLRYLTNLTSLVPINGTELRDVSQDIFPYPQKFWLPFIDNVKKVAPNAVVTVMRDEDVHDGHIFRSQDKTNAFDILLLFHNEYVTQQEYNNLKHFVKNGGTIVFIDANALYAEVHYNRDNDTVTLVNGHDWEFDGKAARRSIPERWFNETKEWMGGNYLTKAIGRNVTFTNNPFNYTHFEEQYVNNLKAEILMDYGVKFKRGDYLREPSLNNTKIASYSIQFGKGKVITLGLSARILSENHEFIKFFDNIILPKALCIKSQPCILNSTTNYLYGCTNYESFGYKCDPISNNFENYQALATFNKITSITRNPAYLETSHGKGIHFAGTHKLESLRAKVIDSYKTNQFTIYLSFKPDKYDKSIGNPSELLASYKNGIYADDNNTSGWEIEFVSNDSTLEKKVRFTVFDTNGNPTHSENIDIPIETYSELAGTFDGKTVRLFVNDTLRSEVPFTGIYSGNVNNNTFLKVAGDGYCTCYLASGTIDEVRYYNYSLNSPQINAINNPSTGDVAKGLIGYWNFDGELKDYSKSHNDMFYNTLMGSMAFTPDGRLFYTEKNSGNIRIIMNDSILEKPFASIPNIHVDFEQGLLGIAIDSKFIENRFVYVYFTYDDYSISNETSVWGRLLRFTDVDNRGTNETIILDRIPASVFGYHAGGALTFNKMEDKLYLTVGDAIDGLRAQNLSSLYGKTIRINRDGGIPNGNPFSGSPIYTYGHRNMYGIAFDDKDHGIVTEPGSASYDEINPIIKGGNYGWPLAQTENFLNQDSYIDQFIEPIKRDYMAYTPTQVIFYNGDKYPELKGKFIAASFTGDLYAYKISDDGRKLLEEIKLNTSIYPSKEVVAISVSPDGEIYFGAYDIFKLNKLDPTSKEQIMYPIFINASNVKISGVYYVENRNELTLDLSERHDSSKIILKLPNPFMNLAFAKYECHSSNMTLTGNANKINIPCPVKIENDKQNNWSLLRFDNTTPVDFQLTIHYPR